MTSPALVCALTVEKPNSFPVSSPDELAGVIGHEIGHVKGRHFARMQEHGKLPELLTNLAGMAGAVATGEPGVLVAAQAANVAMQLRWSREFEAESDQSAVVLAQRTGYDPAAITRFFERILAEQRRLPAQEIPPYLYSHPEVESRVFPPLLNVGTWHGYAGFAEMTAGWESAFGEIRYDERGMEAPDERHVLVTVHQTATGAGSGVPVELDVFFLVEFEGDQAIRFQIHADRDSALESI